MSILFFWLRICWNHLKPIWGFPEIEVTPKPIQIIHFNGIFIDFPLQTNHSGGTPMAMETPVEAPRHPLEELRLGSMCPHRSRSRAKSPQSPKPKRMQSSPRPSKMFGDIYHMVMELISHDLTWFNHLMNILTKTMLSSVFSLSLCLSLSLSTMFPSICMRMWDVFFCQNAPCGKAKGPGAIYFPLTSRRLRPKNGGWTVEHGIPEHGWGHIQPAQHVNDVTIYIYIYIHTHICIYIYIYVYV